MRRFFSGKVFFKLLTVFLIILISSFVIYADEIICQDDFEDGNLDAADPDLLNGMTWTADGSLSNNELKSWPGKALRMNVGAYVISNNVIEQTEYTLSFDAINWYNTQNRVMIAYQDEDNYYSFDHTRGSLWRCLDGVEEKLTDSAVGRLINSPRQNPSINNYKIYYCHNNNSITIAVDRDGYENRKDYEFTYTDTNMEAVNRLKSGRIKLVCTDTGTSHFYVNYDNILVTTGKRLDTPLREPRKLYISTTGDDNSTGTENNPFRTIEKAVDYSIPGDEIIVEDGSYDEEISFKSNRVYGEKEKRLIIRSRNNQQAIINSADLKYGDYVTVDGFEVVQSSININGSTGVNVFNNYIHDLAGKAGINASGIDGWVAGNHIFKTNKGINVSGKNMLVENNEIERLIYTNQDADYFRFFGEGHIIRGNYMHGTSQAEIGPSHTDGFQTFDNNGEYARHIIIERNFIEDFYAQGFMGEGKFYYHSYDITFRNNIFKDAGAWGLCMHSLQDVKVYNNLFYNMNIHGIGFRGDDDKPSTGEVCNNIFYNGGSLYGGIDRQTDASNNLIYSTDPYKKYKQEDFPNDIVNLDPLLIDPENNDFRIHPNSPAVDSGIRIDGFSDDYDGNSRPYNDKWDIGPHEFQGTDMPAAYINYSNVVSSLSGYEPFKVHFDASKSFAPEGKTIVSYDWDFGDDSKGTGIMVDHIFSAGEHTVELTVTDDNGNKDSTSRDFNVLPAEHPNLYLHLPLDGEFVDASGKNMEVSWNGDPLYEEVYNGKAARFNQDKSRGIVVDHSDYLDGQEEMTLAFWAKKDIADKGAIVIHKHIVYRFNLTASGIGIYLYNVDGEQVETEAKGITEDTKWHHYAVVYNGSHVLIYIDGIESARAGFSGRIKRASSRDIMIGRNHWGDSLDGLMDDIRIYDKALSVEEIKGIAEETIPSFISPKILKQAESQTASLGSQVVFTVEASGYPELEYQWYHDGSAIDGTTTNELIIDNVQQGDEGEYTVEIKNIAGSVTSEAAILTVVDPLPPMKFINGIVEFNNVYLSWGDTDGQGEEWDNFCVFRNTGETPVNYNNGVKIYDGSGTSFYDSNLKEGRYHYIVYRYKEYETNPVYSEPSEIFEAVVPESFNKNLVKIIAGKDNSANNPEIAIGQNTKGDLYSLWNDEKLSIGRGPTGNQTSLWLYSDIVGNGENQVPADSKIVSARLVFTVEDCSFKDGSIYSGGNEISNNNAHGICVYQITDPDNFGQPYYADESGIRVGLDYYYRDYRPGMNIPWLNPGVNPEEDNKEAASIIDLLENEESSEIVDIMEFNPEVFVNDKINTIHFDISKAVQAWLDGEENRGENQGLFITTGQGWANGEELILSGIFTEGEQSAPYLEIIYGNSGDDLEGPEAVSGLGITSGENSISLEWDEIDTTQSINEHFAGVKILRREGIIPYSPYDGKESYEGISITFIDGNDNSYTDTGVERGKTYYYALYTYDSYHNYSNGVWVKAVPGVLSEAPVLAADSLNIDAGQVSFSWQPVTGADSYRVYRKDVSNGISGYETIEAVENQRTIFTEPLLKGNYIYQITAVNEFGEGPLSDEIEVIVDDNNAAGQEPADPSNLEGKILAEFAVELSWYDNSDNESIFVIERQKENGEWGLIGISGYDNNTYIDREIPAAAQLSYRVKAVNSAGTSGYSNTMEIDIPASNISWNVISASHIKVEWTGILESGVYKLELYELEDENEALDTQYISGNLSDNTFENTNYCYFVNLEPGKEYWVEISFNLDGEVEDNEITVKSDIIRTSADAKGGLF